MYCALRLGERTTPRWPTLLGQARRPLAPVLGFRPQTFYRAAASE